MINKFYEVIEPFFHFRKVGWAESNTYIGRSMALTTVFESRNALPGTQIHALVGGTFLVDDDGPHEIRIRLPKPILEKSYLNYRDTHYLDQIVARGLLREIPAPSEKIDYAAGRPDTEFPPLTSQLTPVDHSAEFEELCFAVPDLQEAVEAVEGWSISISDMRQERDVAITVANEKRQRMIWMNLDTVTGSTVVMLDEHFAAKTDGGSSIALVVEGAKCDCEGRRVIIPEGLFYSISAIQSMLAVDVEAYAESLHAEPSSGGNKPA